MSKSNLRITAEEWAVLNNNIECNNARAKVASVLNYLKKYIELNGGSFSKSLAKIHMFYSRSHFKFTLTHFKNIINRLKEFGLIAIEKVKNRNVYTLPVTKKVTEKVTEKKSNESIDNTKLKDDNSKHRYSDLVDNKFNLPITYNNIIDELKSSYKGIKKVSDIATKKELKEIAEVLFVANNVNSNSRRDKYIQYLVLRKIKFSLKKIKFSGAVSYIETILFEKMIEVDSGSKEIPVWITEGNKVISRPVNFTQRNYTSEDYAQWEKEWQEAQWNGTALI
ncbi:hypothetical protein N2W44_002643 [Clostridium perfringens]|nr:hypothetical protein [Clostridium perfringens]EJT6532462.1 hypothetical protein [Clostridium perfringens]